MLTKASPLKRLLAVGSMLATVRASMPAPIISRNRRSLTLPRSREMVLSPAMTLQARSTWKGRPKFQGQHVDRAGGHDPQERLQRAGMGASRAQAMPLVTSLTVPSPPMATTTSAPRADVGR